MKLARITDHEVAVPQVEHFEGAAVDVDLIKSNPAYRMRLPRDDHDAGEMVFLTQAEFARVLQLLDEHWHPLVLLLGLTGMRGGEATALRV